MLYPPVETLQEIKHPFFYIHRAAMPLFRWLVQITVGHILKGEDDPFSPGRGKVDAFYHFKGFSAFQPVDDNGEILTDGTVEITDLQVMAASPVIRTHICSFISVSDLGIGAVQLVIAHVLLQAQAAFFTDQLNIDRGIGSVNVACIEIIKTFLNMIAASAASSTFTK